MADGSKKISFGFAKSIKKPVLQNAPVQEKKVDYIECLDEKSIKVIGEEEKIDEPLVIPMLGSRTWYDRIVSTIDIFVPKVIPNESVSSITIKEEPIDVPNGNTDNDIPTESVAQIKKESKDESSTPATLDELAAKEIIQELKSTDIQTNKNETLTLPVKDNQDLGGREESSLQDYEQIPVDAFGMAMLRGMGWQPGKGIGKNGKIVAAVTPELRPKGMGLGADKVTVKKLTANSKGKSNDELKLEKGSFVKIIAGKQNNNYGQVEGFDDDAGRLIVKLALGGETISLSEFMIQQVTKVEYAKNSKVLNASKYEKYKNKEATDVTYISSESSDNNDETEQKSKHKKKRSKDESRSRKHRKRESNNDDDVERKSRKRRSSSSSESHKPKKSKKHKKHDNSPERMSKKHKKREKEREKSKDRKKNKKHKRSKSRSPKKR